MTADSIDEQVFSHEPNPCQRANAWGSNPVDWSGQYHLF
jgi:hypothetical protein